MRWDKRDMAAKRFSSLGTGSTLNLPTPTPQDLPRNARIEAIVAKLFHGLSRISPYLSFRFIRPESSNGFQGPPLLDKVRQVFQSLGAN